MPPLTINPRTHTRPPPPPPFVYDPYNCVYVQSVVPSGACVPRNPPQHHQISAKHSPSPSTTKHTSLIRTTPTKPTSRPPSPPSPTSELLFRRRLSTSLTNTLTIDITTLIPPSDPRLFHPPAQWDLDASANPGLGTAGSNRETYYIWLQRETDRRVEAGENTECELDYFLCGPDCGAWIRHTEEKEEITELDMARLEKGKRRRMVEVVRVDEDGEDVVVEQEEGHEEGPPEKLRKIYNNGEVGIQEVRLGWELDKVLREVEELRAKCEIQKQAGEVLARKYREEREMRIEAEGRCTEERRRREAAERSAMERMARTYNGQRKMTAGILSDRSNGGLLSRVIRGLGRPSLI